MRGNTQEGAAMTERKDFESAGKVIAPELLSLRRITESEYSAIPAKHKSKAIMWLSPGGILYILLVLFSVIFEATSAAELIKGTRDAGAMLFVSTMLGFTFIAFGAIFMRMKLDRYVTRETLAAAGSVMSADIYRSSKGTVLRAEYKVALLALGGMTVISDPKATLSEGDSVLIVKSTSGKYYLFPMPEAVMDTETSAGHGEELAAILGGSPEEYGDYTKADIFAAGHNRLTDSDLKRLPRRAFSPGVLEHGAESVIWALFVMGALVLLYFLFRSWRVRDMMLFAALAVGFVCEMVVTLMLTYSVLKKPLSPAQIFYADCVIIKKASLSGKCTASLIVPEAELFIEAVPVSPRLYRDLPLNAPARVYYSALAGEMIYAELR